MTTMVTESQVYEALRGVDDPELHHNLVELGLIREVEVIDDRVHVDIQLTTPHCPFADQIVAAIRQAVLDVEGVNEVQVDRACTQDD